MVLGGEDPGKEWKTAAGVTKDGQKICAFFAKKQRADGSCTSKTRTDSVLTYTKTCLGKCGSEGEWKASK